MNHTGPSFRVFPGMPFLNLDGDRHTEGRSDFTSPLHSSALTEKHSTGSKRNVQLFQRPLTAERDRSSPHNSNLELLRFCEVSSAWFTVFMVGNVWDGFIHENPAFG
jgi:hypothetical protein